MSTLNNRQKDAIINSNVLTDINSNSYKKKIVSFNNMEELLENGDQEFLKSIAKNEKEKSAQSEDIEEKEKEKPEINNSFLVFADSEKIILNKGKLIKYGRSIAKLNFFDYLGIEDFCLSFNFNFNKKDEIDSKNFDNNEEIENSNDIANPYCLNFEEPCDKLNLLCSQEKITLYNKKWKPQILSFGESPLEYISHLENKKGNLKFNYDLFFNKIDSFPSFSEKYYGLVTFRTDQISPKNKIINNSRIDNPEITPIISKNKRSGYSSDGDINVSLENEEENSILSNKSNNKKNIKPIICEFCHSSFSTPQAYGGHLSRSHHEISINKSNHINNKNGNIYHYSSSGKKRCNKKSKIVKNVNIEKAKKILCENHDINYSNLIKTKKGKLQLKKILVQYEKEYKEIRKNLLD